MDKLFKKELARIKALVADLESTQTISSDDITAEVLKSLGSRIEGDATKVGILAETEPTVATFSPLLSEVYSHLMSAVACAKAIAPPGSPLVVPVLTATVAKCVKTMILSMCELLTIVQEITRASKPNPESSQKMTIAIGQLWQHSKAFQVLPLTSPEAAKHAMLKNVRFLADALSEAEGIQVGEPEDKNNDNDNDDVFGGSFDECITQQQGIWLAHCKHLIRLAHDTTKRVAVYFGLLAHTLTSTTHQTTPTNLTTANITWITELCESCERFPALCDDVVCVFHDQPIEADQVLDATKLLANELQHFLRACSRKHDEQADNPLSQQKGFSQWHENTNDELHKLTNTISSELTAP